MVILQKSILIFRFVFILGSSQTKKVVLENVCRPTVFVHTAELVLTKFTSNIYFGLTYFSHEKLFCKYTLILAKNLKK